jgi:hypothetical protein
VSKGNSSQRDPDWKPGSCRFCKKQGYWKKDCRKLKAKIEAEKNKNEAQKTTTIPEDIGSISEAWIASTFRTTTDKRGWVLDSGCTQHMTPNKDYFRDYQRWNIKVIVANDDKLETAGQGTIKIKYENRDISIPDVLHVPNLGCNLLSVSQLAERGITTKFEKDKAELRRGDKVLAVARRQGRSYVLREVEQALLAISKSNDNESRLWHRRLGNIGNDKLVKASKTLLGVPELTPIPEIYETYSLSKDTRRQNRESINRAKELLQRVFIDYWGPYKNLSLGGNRYILTLTDDYSRRSLIKLIKTRDELYDKFRELRQETKLQSGRILKICRSDNTKEFQKLAKLF